MTEIIFSSILFLSFCQYMRFFLLAMTMIFATAGCAQTPENKTTQKEEKIPQAFAAISPEEFKKMSTKDNVIVIDIRTPQEIVQGKAIDTAKEMDFYAPGFRAQIESLDPEKTYLLYCRSGNRTSTAKSLMQNMGFKNVYDLRGGIGAWERSGCKTICKK